MVFNPNDVKVTDWGVMGCAAALLLFSFVDSFVTADVAASGELATALQGLETSVGENAWNSYAALGLLLLLAVGAAAAARVFAGLSLPPLPIGWNLLFAGAAGLGALLVVLRAFTYSVEGGDITGLSVDVGPGWSGWLVMLLAVAETVFAVRAFRESGEQVPWQQTSSRRPPA